MTAFAIRITNPESWRDFTATVEAETPAEAIHKLARAIPEYESDEVVISDLDSAYHKDW